ncbi:ligase-associated DNA damage response DEXH box helicase [Lentisalinibacter salinarum]|uniref:ligase-associated DNA damage response DEXH box helicase n=1 Tax=Lentisalinibacter salinarum TaxID=2992239 RepID=UPI003868A7C4
MSENLTASVTGDFDARLQAWFDERGWRLFDFQREARDAYLAGESGLIHSPTGSGKSLAAWLGPLAEAAAAGGADGGPRVLWITPLRALAVDTRENLADAAAALGSDWRVEVRSGDTSQSVRARQRRRPPEALVTTPESLSVLLSYADGASWFRRLACVVVDEWHELLGTKRGVQLELCLARLRSIAPGLRTWGLSATLANLAEARDVLLGPGTAGRLVRGHAPKTVRIRSVLPETLERFPWAGHLGVRLLPAVVEAIESKGSTLLFTNTRSQAELWFQGLVDARPDWVGRIALHHGSIDRKLRQRIEDGLRAGELRCVVCTSSLDLGVDFSPVDQVMQVGSPKGVARLLQRAGRSGHQPGAVSEVLCVPTHAFELVEIAAARRAAEQGRIEARRPLLRSLDVLAQHLVTVALGGGFEAEAMRAEVSRTHAFAGISDAEWGWVMDFVTRGGQALQGYPQYRRVEAVDGRYRVTDRGIGQRHRMGIGTIASDTAMNIRWLTGGSLGTIEESFVSRLQRGDRFLFAGRLVELARVRDMTAYVRRAKKGRRTVPRWQGGRMPLSTELADSVLEVLAAAGSGADEPAEVNAVAGLLDLQRRWSRLPVPGELLVEVTRSREGVSLFCYPFAGRLVHEGLATLIAWRLSRETPATFTLSANDYGLELLCREEPAIDEERLTRLFAPGDLEVDLLACMNTGEIARRRFRDIARIAGLVFQGYPGRGKSTRQIQASSGLIFDVLERYDSDNLLLDQARREVLESQLEARRMREALAAIGGKRIVIERPERLTPLAFPLWAERLQSQIMSSETWRDRVERMAASLERAAERRRKSA